MNAAPTQFSDLIARAKAGDDAALGPLLDDYIRKLYSDARRLIGKRLRPLVDPADLLQSTRVILWIGLRNRSLNVDSPQQLMALAKTVLRRQAARVCRALKSEFGTATIEFQLADTIVDMPIGPGGNSQDPGEETDLQDAVQRILSGLDDVDRELVRYRLLGYTTDYVARKM